MNLWEYVSTHLFLTNEEMIKNEKKVYRWKFMMYAF